MWLARTLCTPSSSKTDVTYNLLGQRESEAVFVMRGWGGGIRGAAKEHKIICIPRSSIIVMVTTTAARELLYTICIIKDTSVASCLCTEVKEVGGS